MWWDKIQYVTSGLTLVAFLITVIAWAYKSKSEELELLIKTAPADSRADLIRSSLEFFDVDTTGLTRNQKYELALAQIHARAHRFRTTAIVVCILTVILAAVSAYTISHSKPAPPKPADQTSTLLSKNESKAASKEKIFDSRGPHRISLTSPTEWNYPGDVLRVQGTVVTNGMPLTINAAKLIADDANLVVSEQPLGKL